ncbi:hypothetical protein V8E53_015892 [Lactarius tabidus]
MFVLFFRFLILVSSSSLSWLENSACLNAHRITLAIPASEHEISAIKFCCDTDLPSPSDEHHGKVHCLTSPASPERNARKNWTVKEMRLLVGGCNCRGANQKMIQVYILTTARLWIASALTLTSAMHYPNAKTRLSSKDARSKIRCSFTEEEDRMLKTGYNKTVWTTIAKGPIFQGQNHRSAHLRDRFRNEFPNLHQAARYEPRNSDEKLSAAAHAATDEHLHASREMGPARRKQRCTAQGFLRRETKRVL